jgi:ADP-heptose:LPS heptosyltransferase
MPSIKQKTAFSLLDIIKSSASGRIIFLKLIDQIAGSFIILCIRALLVFNPKKVEFILGNVKNVLIIRPGGIGDAVWLLPLIRILKQKTGCSIDVLCERRNNAVFNSCREDICHVWMYDDGIFKLINNLVRQDYDCVIDTEQYHNFSAIFSYLASSKCRIGFDTVPSRSTLYTHQVLYSLDAQEYKMFLDLFNVLIPITVQEYLGQMGMDFAEIDMQFFPAELRDHQFITVYIGASVKEKFWGVEKFAQLCAEIVKLGYRVVLVGGKEDINKAGEIRQLFNHDKMIDLVGKTTLMQTVAALKQGLLIIGADSGIMHLASAVDCPSLWLFGASNKHKWLFEHSRHESIELHLPCSPCAVFGYTPRCPYDVRCLKDIGVTQVVDRIKIIMAKDIG